MRECEPGTRLGDLAHVRLAFHILRTHTGDHRCWLVRHSPRLHPWSQSNYIPPAPFQSLKCLGLEYKYDLYTCSHTRTFTITMRTH